jgi:hypothetical protein
MTRAIQKPLLLRSPLTGQVYIVTRYHRDEARNGAVVAHRKYEVTADELRAIGLTVEEVSTS